MNRYSALVIGTSAGGLNALTRIIPALNKGFPVPIIIVQHMSPEGSNFTSSYLDTISSLNVREGDEKEMLEPGTVYLAAPNYHLLIDRNKTLSLSVDAKVNYSRPSIDVLFESAAEVYREKLLALVLTGANSDGTKGALKVIEFGGSVLVQDPETAEAAAMPLSVIEHCQVEAILPLDEIADYLNTKIYEKEN
ncbi:MAG: chemotaxis protein CheB [Spirochaetales bacterium]|nr:chemotaxis protein CheB [Spirochaetales bacterium]